MIPLTTRGDIKSPNYQIMQEGLELKREAPDQERLPEDLASGGREESNWEILIIAGLFFILFSFSLYNILKKK